MKRKAELQSQVLAMGFTVTVDGKTYGPYQEKDREKFNYLAHKKGVEIKPVHLRGDSSLSLSLSLSLLAGKSRSKSILRFLMAWISCQLGGCGFKGFNPALPVI